MSRLEQGFPKNERTNIKIEHYPECDVIVNLDYPLEKDRHDILFSIKSSIEDKRLYALDLNIGNLENENGERRFYVKRKRDLIHQVNFLTGRVGIDPIKNIYKGDFDRKARYARTSITNEMLLASKIKNLVDSDEFQELVKGYGFSSFSFPEPIVAFIRKDIDEKYLVYKRVISNTLAPATKITVEANLVSLIEELRKMFLKHGIFPSDLLRSDQFIVESREGQIHLTLIDTEAYTDRSKFKDFPES